MIELLPCPFCGNIDTTIVTSSGYGEGGEQCYAICETCNMTTGIVDTKEEAIRVWNTRYYTPWIKCSERIPEPEEYVLVVDTDKTQYIMERSQYRNSWILDGEEYRYSDFITHWMPLPTPPEVEP